MKMNKFGLTETETKLFHFHRIFKNGIFKNEGQEVLEPPLDLPLVFSFSFRLKWINSLLTLVRPHFPEIERCH